MDCLEILYHRYYRIGMSTQLSLIAGTWSKNRFAFGGALLKGSHAKKKRTFVPNLPIHVVMRSSKARGAWSLLVHNKTIARVLARQCALHHVEVLNAANAGNHLHLLVKAPSRELLSAFLRGLSGAIAMLVTGAKKNHPCQSKRHETGNGNKGDNALARKGFWDARPFTRVVSMGQDLLRVARYISLNSTETASARGAQEHSQARRDVRAMFERIQEYLSQGLLPRSPSLIAAGFT